MYQGDKINIPTRSIPASTYQQKKTKKNIDIKVVLKKRSVTRFDHKPKIRLFLPQTWIQHIPTGKWAGWNEIVTLPDIQFKQGFLSLKSS